MTTNPTSKLMLTILAGVETWEREIMLERQREGIATAKEGKYKGRPASIDAAQIRRLTATMGPAAIASNSGSPEAPSIGCSDKPLPARNTDRITPMSSSRW
jgi:DNA invertase Pin-like site-specific DNA recombinase